MPDMKKYVLTAAVGAAVGGFLVLAAPKMRPKLDEMREKLGCRCRERMGCFGKPLAEEPKVEEPEEVLR